MFRALLLPILLSVLLLASPARAAGDDDERWIERFMQQRRSTPVAAVGGGLGFAELRSHLGSAVEVRLVDGRVRRGRVHAVAGEHVTLANNVAGGSYLYTLARAQIARVQLEGAR